MPSDAIVSSSAAKQPTDGWRFPDLSRIDDLKDPVYRLAGILNYCDQLAHYYKPAAEHLWQAQRSAAIRTDRSWKSRDATTKAYDEDTIHLVGVCDKLCDEYWAMLRALCDAALPLMPEVTVKLKVLKFSSSPLHRLQDTDWQAFEADLAIISARARVLYAHAQGTLPDLPTPTAKPGYAAKPANGAGNGGKAKRRKATGKYIKDKPLTGPQKAALDMLALCKGIKTEAAKRLGISRQALNDRLNGVKLRGDLARGKSVKAMRLPHDRREQPSV